MSARIVIIEDDPDICEILEYNLQQEGYASVYSMMVKKDWMQSSKIPPI